MRILHVMRAPVGGLFRHVVDLATEQSRRGHDVGVVMGSTGDELTDRRLDEVATDLTLGVHRLAMGRAVGFTDVTACRSVARIARTVACGILHGHGAKGGAYARLAGAALSTPVYYTPHGGMLHYAPRSLAGRLYHGVERRLDRLTAGLIFESAHAADTYCRVIGRGSAPQRVIHNGLRPSDFTRRLARDDAADVLFVGELRVLKGVDTLLDALAQLATTTRGQSVRAVIVGEGPDRAIFEDQTARLGLRDTVTFTGAMPAADAFPLGRMLVVPSRKESLPYIVLEAAAAGLPLIATSVGGIPEIVAGTNTPLIPSDSPSALAGAIAAALADPLAASKCAAELRAHVATRFTVAAMADGVLDFYRAASSQRPDRIALGAAA